MEIKFRAWNGKSMIEPYSIRNGKCYIIKSCDLNEEPVTYKGSHYYKNWDIDVCTDYPVMQFTGLTDKNGKDVYAGDIFAGKSKVFGDTCGKVDMSQYEDCEAYQHETHLGWNVAGIPLVDLADDGLEIIGNIHQNPELLEVNNG